MRGRSFLILLVVAVAVGGYAYYQSTRDSSASLPKENKVFAGVDAEKIQDIEVHAANGDTTKVARDGAAWKIVAPLAGDADASEATSLGSTLSTLTAGTEVDPNPTSVKEYGLDPARIMVTFHLTGDAQPHTLLVGIKTPTGGDLYARVDGQPKLFLIGGSNEDSLNKTTFNLRDKTVLKFQRDGVDSLQIEQGGKTVLVEKKSNSEWHMKTPIDARADASAIDGLVGRLFQLQMKSLVTADGSAELKKYGLDKPDVTATVGAGSTRASLALGGKSPDGAIYARDLARPMIFTLEANLADDLKRKPDDLRLKDLFEFRTFSAVGLDVTQGGQTSSFTKQKGPNDTEVWKQTTPAAKDVDTAKMTDLLSALSGLRADSFVDKASATADEVVVVARFGDPASPREERVTFRSEKGKTGTTVQATRTNDPGAGVVSSTEYDKAVTALKAITGK